MFYDKIQVFLGMQRNNGMDFIKTIWYPSGGTRTNIPLRYEMQKLYKELTTRVTFCGERMPLSRVNEARQVSSSLKKYLIFYLLKKSNHDCAITDSNSRNQTANKVGGGESVNLLSIYTPLATNLCFQHIQYTTVAETFALTIDTRTRKRFQLPALRAYKEFGLCGLHLLLLM